MLLSALLMKVLTLFCAATAFAQTIPLDPATMRLTEVKAEGVTWKGRAAVRITDNAP